jgi:hypothetical protein
MALAMTVAAINPYWGKALRILEVSTHDQVENLCRKFVQNLIGKGKGKTKHKENYNDLWHEG